MFSLPRAVALLVCAFAIAFPAFAYFGHESHGQAGVLAAAIAAAALEVIRTRFGTDIAFDVVMVDRMGAVIARAGP